MSKAITGGIFVPESVAKEIDFERSRLAVERDKQIQESQKKRFIDRLLEIKKPVDGIESTLERKLHFVVFRLINSGAYFNVKFSPKEIGELIEDIVFDEERVERHA